jgi:hypothetical protein
LSLSNSKYAVRSQSWDFGLIPDVGAVSIGSATTGLTGVVSAANSLIGSTAMDRIFGGFPQVNGSVVVSSPVWDNGILLDAGAVSLLPANTPATGQINSSNSVLGLVANSGSANTFGYDPTRNQLVVGQRQSNRVVLHRSGLETTTSIISSAPNPSTPGQLVTFSAQVSASAAPTNGRVTFQASSGSSCVDATPSAASSTSASFSCQMSFSATGSVSVSAEYTGSESFAYSAAMPLTHAVGTQQNLIFANGFE